MTKDDQIKFLADALRSIRDDHAPWHGEDAVNMMNNAHDALVEWANKVNRPDADRCSCAGDQGGPCSACMEAKYNL